MPPVTRSPQAPARPAAFILTVIAAIFIALVAATVAPTDARAHASFLESAPAPGARLAQAPEKFKLEFTEPLNERLTKVTLIDARNDDQIAADIRVVGGRRLTVHPERRLEQAAYRIDWHSVSTVDGHVKQGSISFGIGTAALGGLELEESPFAAGGWLRISARMVLYLALFFFAGGVMLAALAGRRGPRESALVPEAARTALAEAGRDADAVARRAWRRTAAAGWLAAAAAFAVALVEARAAAGTLSPASVGDFLFSNGAGLARVATVAALVAAAAATRRAPRAAAGFAAVSLLSIALSGHANSADQRLAAVASDWVHLVAGAAWVGGLAQIASVWLPATRRAGRSLRRVVARAVLPAFGRIALPAFLLVSVTGLANALIQLGEPSALWQTGYGRVLAVKVALVAAIALASYLHAFRLRPRMLAAEPQASAVLQRRHWRLLGSEPFLGVGVLAVAALLVAFPLPPSQAGAVPALPACDPCPLANPAPDELAVAEPAGPLTVAAWLRRDERATVGTLRVLTDKRKPARVDARVAGAERQAACGPGCWTIRVPAGAEALGVRIRHGAERYSARLPARWHTGANRRARRLVEDAQRTMRALDTLRQTEVVESSPGYSARTEFRFDAPDRMAYETKTSGRIIVGEREWLKAPGLPWQQQPRSRTQTGFASPGKRFRWSVFLPSARLLTTKREGGRRIAEIAFFDYGYPVWYRLKVDLATNRALRATLITPANRIYHRYHAFNQPIRIEPPAATFGD